MKSTRLPLLCCVNTAPTRTGSPPPSSQWVVNSVGVVALLLYMEVPWGVSLQCARSARTWPRSWQWMDIGSRTEAPHPALCLCLRCASACVVCVCYFGPIFPIGQRDTGNIVFPYTRLLRFLLGQCPQGLQDSYDRCKRCPVSQLRVLAIELYHTQRWALPHTRPKPTPQRRVRSQSHKGRMRFFQT